MDREFPPMRSIGKPAPGGSPEEVTGSEAVTKGDVIKRVRVVGAIGLATAMVLTWSAAVVGGGPKEPAPVSGPLTPGPESKNPPEVAGTSQGLVETVYPMTEEEAKALNEKGIEGVVGLLEHLKSLSVAEQYDEGKDPVVFKATDEGAGVSYIVSMGGLYSSTEKRTGFLVSVNRYPDDRKFIGSPDKAMTAKFAMEGEFKSPKSIEEAISLLESGQATIVGLSTLDSTGLKDDGPTTLVEYKFTKGELKIKTRGMSPGGGGELSSISSIYKER